MKSGATGPAGSASDGSSPIRDVVDVGASAVGERDGEGPGVATLLEVVPDPASLPLPHAAAVKTMAISTNKRIRICRVYRDHVSMRRALRTDAEKRKMGPLE